MATGLLGINPYSSGVNLDLSSKTANMAIQKEQKEQAKREATEKYLMDYQKSINPAGMRHIDAQLYTKNMADAQDYFIKNREKILNPTKYGYEYQATHLANLKDAGSLIDESKMAAANEKEFNGYATRAAIAGKNPTSQSLIYLNKAHNFNVRDPQYRSLSGSDFQVVQPFNAKKHEEEVYGGVSLPVREETKDLGNGQEQTIKRSYLPTYEEESKLGGPKNIDKIDANTVYNYKNNEASKEMYDEMLQDKTTAAAAKAEYKRVRGVDPVNNMQVIQGYNYMNTPNQKYEEGKPSDTKAKIAEDIFTEWLKRHKITVRDKATQDANLAGLQSYLPGVLASLGTGKHPADAPDYEYSNLDKKVIDDQTKPIKVITKEADMVKKKAGLSYDTKDDKLIPISVQRGGKQYVVYPKQDEYGRPVEGKYDWSNPTEVTNKVIQSAVSDYAGSKYKSGQFQRLIGKDAATTAAPQGELKPGFKM